jgi:hypothetical protein
MVAGFSYQTTADGNGVANIVSSSGLIADFLLFFEPKVK